MKYITLIIGLLVVGCGTPVKELTLEGKVIGTYERKLRAYTYRWVLIENGIVETYVNGEEHAEAKWKIVGGELNLIAELAIGTWVDVLRINKDDSLTVIAYINNDGKRIDLAEQVTWKKIK